MSLAKGTALARVNTLDGGGSLYHYTTGAALVNIVTNNEFWVTHANFLNDYAEVNYIEGVAREAIDSLCAAPEAARELTEALLAQFDRLRQGFHQMYMLSFSTKYDSLTLWSEFSGGEGYFMEFGAQDFRSHISVSDPSFRYYTEGSVVYDRPEQLAILREEILEPWLKEAPLKTAADIDALRPLLPALAMSIYEYAPFFKDATFAGEYEYRFVFYYRERARDGKVPCSFRSRDNNVIPFVRVSLKLADGSKVPLRRIVAGPKNKSDLAVSGTRYLLECNGYPTTEVVKSAVTLRY